MPGLRRPWRRGPPRASPGSLSLQPRGADTDLSPPPPPAKAGTAVPSGGPQAGRAARDVTGCGAPGWGPGFTSSHTHGRTHRTAGQSSVREAAVKAWPGSRSCPQLPRVFRDDHRVAKVPARWPMWESGARLRRLSKPEVFQGSGLLFSCCCLKAQWTWAQSLARPQPKTVLYTSLPQYSLLSTIHSKLACKLHITDLVSGWWLPLYSWLSQVVWITALSENSLHSKSRFPSVPSREDRVKGSSKTKYYNLEGGVHLPSEILGTDSSGSMPCTKQSCGRLKARTLVLKVIYYFTVSLSVNFLDVGCNDT